MNTENKLSYTQMQNISGKLSEYSTTMELVLNEIKALFEKIGTEDVWSGTAAASKKDEFDLLSSKFPEFSAAVLDCKKYLDNVLETYQAADKAVTSQQ